MCIGGNNGLLFVDIGLWEYVGKFHIYFLIKKNLTVISFLQIPLRLSQTIY